MRGTISNITVMLALLVGVGSAQATVYTVGDDPGDDFDTIGGALAFVSSGDDISIDDGTYEEHDLVLVSGISIYPTSGNPGMVEIDAQNQGRVFIANNITIQTVITGIDLTNGTALPTSYGGGIFGTNACLRLVDCTIDDCDARKGGAIFLTFSELSTEGCVFSSNTATRNGGALCLESTMYDDYDSDFYMNHVDEAAVINYAYGGGAIYLVAEDDGKEYTMELELTTFHSNYSIQQGGAIYGICALIDLEDCVFDRNWVVDRTDKIASACMGGAIYGGYNTEEDDGRLEMNNCEFSENFIDDREVTTTTSLGGAIALEQFAIVADSTTFDSNGCNEIDETVVETSTGGAIYGELWVDAGEDQCAISNCTFAGNSVTSTGGAVYLEGTMLTTMKFARCDFISNSTTCNSTNPGSGGAVYLSTTFMASRTYEETSFYDCLFVDCTAYYGSAIYSYDESLYLQSCTIADCFTGTTGNGSEIWVNDSYHPSMTLDINSTCIAYGQGYSCYIIDGTYSPTIDISCCDFYGNYYNWSGDISGFENINGNMTEQPLFVDRFDNGIYDYNLRWDSPCYDVGDPSLDLDYDLTRIDIGWKTVYEPVELEEEDSPFSSLDVGWYYVDEENDVLLAANELEIPAGTIIKVGTDAILELYAGTGAQPPLVSVGSSDGQRTSIVGKLQETDQGSADAIFFDGTLMGQGTPSVTLDGVLLNYSSATGLVFSNCDVDVTSPEVQLQHYYDGYITFKKCSGSLVDFNFTTGVSPYYVDNLAKVSCTHSNVDISGCTFRPPTDAIHEGWSLKIYGSQSRSDIKLLNNTFQADEDEQDSVTPLLLDVTPVRLLGNHFGDRDQDEAFPVTIIDQHNSTNHMCQDGGGAYNWLYGDSPDPLIYLDDGDLDLYCGYNDFRQLQAESPGWAPFVEEGIDGDENFTNWSMNYWGNTVNCDDPPLSELVLRTNYLIPDWVDTPMAINSECDDTWSALQCDARSGGGSQQFATGLSAEMAGNYSSAVSNYFQVLELYPESEYANESTLRVKAIVLDTGYGASNCETLQATLLGFADSTASISPELATLERSAAWCIHALYIDPGNAETELTVLRNAASSSTSIKCLDLALLEILTYPPPNGLESAPNAAQQIATARYYHQRVEDLLNYGRPLPQAEPRPAPNTTPQPSRLELLNCYPNPFNPSTRINYRLGQAAAVEINVYNLRVAR